MADEGRLTDRQRQIKDMLESNMSAQQIADDLGVTRNAVYQQIQAIRRKGQLAPDYTPSGQPRREAGIMVLDGDSPLVAQLTRVLEQEIKYHEERASQLRKQIGA